MYCEQPACMSLQQDTTYVNAGGVTAVSGSYASLSVKLALAGLPKRGDDLLTQQCSGLITKQLPYFEDGCRHIV